MNSRKLDFQIRNTLLIFCLMLFGLSVNSFAAPGDLDLSFGNGGKIIDLQLSGSINVIPRGNDVVIQSDGKIVIVVNGIDFVVMRYNPDGSPDVSFGNNGKVITSLTPYNDVARVVAIQRDGKIVVAGQAGGHPDYLGERFFDYGVVRYNANGSLDTSFGENGIVVTPVDVGEEYVETIAIQNDDKIVIGGYGIDYERVTSQAQYSVVRYDANGSLDPSFGNGGKLVTQFERFTHTLSNLAIQTDNKIVISGRSLLVRLNSDGSFDRSFGSNGVVDGDFDGFSTLALQSDGKIVVAGSMSVTSISRQFIVERYNSNGSRDTTFGSNGSVSTSITPYGDYAFDVAIQRNGKILVIGSVGYVGTEFQSNPSSFGLVRINPDGSLDTSFGMNGKVITKFGSGNSSSLAFAGTIQNDGKIVVVGYTTSSSVFLLAVARYQGDKNSQFDFDGDGKSDISVFRPSNGVWYLLNSTSGFTAAQFGVSTDKLVPADYDGDGKTDIAVYRNGTWYLNRSSAGFTGIAFGEASDIPQPADFDGDGKAELVVYRPSNGTWYVLNIGKTHSNFQFGASTDKPVVGDYDGDGKADYAVYRPSSGTWYLQRSTLGFVGIKFGEATDKPVPADYDGDGKTDIAVFRPSNGVWYLNRSTQGFTGIQFGVSTDLPTPADYDGDGKTDIAVFRDGIWYLQQTTAGFAGIQFGAATDKPVPDAFIP